MHGAGSGGGFVETPWLDSSSLDWQPGLKSQVDAPPLWQPGGPRENFALAQVPLVAETEAEAHESDNEEQVVLESRPFGLEIASRSDGRGAVVRQAEGAAAAAGLELGATILSINEQIVEHWHTSEIQGHLDDERLPLTLGLRPPLSLPTAKKRKARRDPVTVCTANCRGSYRVVQEAIQRLGWREITEQARDASVMWLEHKDPTEGLAPVQVVSRLEAFLSFCRKARLASALNCWIEEFPEVFAFSPKAWVLPAEAEDLEATMARSKDTFIAKPTGGYQGRGIILTRKWKDLSDIVQKCRSALAANNVSPETRQYVVQRYIAQPLLLEGLKFDLRLYVVVTSVVPLRAYLFKEGLARFCTVPYHPPKEGNLKDKCMHLTNFSVNERSKDFQTSEGLIHHDEGSKRSVSAVFHQIEKAMGANCEELWFKVAKLAANTLMALRPGLVEFYVHERPGFLHPFGPKGFQIIGLDVIIDNELEPRLLELNANPSLSAVQPVNVDVNGTDAATGQDVSSAPSTEVASRRQASSERLPRETGVGPSVPTTGAGRRARSLRGQGRSRLGIDGARETVVGEHEHPVMTSELDLEIKRELVGQALLLARPAPQNKVSRLRRQWQQDGRSSGTEAVPLDDHGSWLPAHRPGRVEAVRADAPDRCPALEALDFKVLAAPEVFEYAQAHLALYRCWRRSCGGSQETLGQAQMQKLMERSSLIGAGRDALFSDKVAAQLWLSRMWRKSSDGAFGLNLPQFVEIVAMLGRMLLAGGLAADAEELGDTTRLSGVLEFVRRGICGTAD